MNTKWKIFLPICISSAYTLAVPLIMILMDFALMPMKRVRITNIYKNKDFITEKKIDHASKEFELKEAESGNKNREELNNKITLLEETNNQLITTHKNTTDQLKLALDQANSSLQKAISDYTDAKASLQKLESENTVQFAKMRSVAQKIYNTMTTTEQQFFKAMIDSKGNFTYEKAPTSIIETFRQKGLIELGENGMKLTPLGDSVHSETIWGS